MPLPAITRHAEPPAVWDALVAQHGSFYHDRRWLLALSRCFDYRLHVLMAGPDAAPTGGLALAEAVPVLPHLHTRRAGGHMPHQLQLAAIGLRGHGRQQQAVRTDRARGIALHPVQPPAACGAAGLQPGVPRVQRIAPEPVFLDDDRRDVDRRLAGRAIDVDVVLFVGGIGRCGGGWLGQALGNKYSSTCEPDGSAAVAIVQHV